jgi:uncharacterized membrane protein HdeD (DUF308 family)
MKETTAKSKANPIIATIIYTLAGLVLAVWPEIATSVLNTALGLVLAIIGGVDIILFLTTRNGVLYSASRLVIGAALVVFGIWLMLRPELLAIIIPRVIGALICVHGVADVGSSVNLRRIGYGKWLAALILGALTIALGVLLIFRPFDVFTTALRIIGIFLLFDGISDLWISSRVRAAARQREKDEAAQRNAVDVEYRDVPPEEDK